MGAGWGYYSDKISLYTKIFYRLILNKKYLHDYHTLDEQFLAGTATVMPNTAGYGYPPVPGKMSEGAEQERIQYGGASFCYNKPEAE